MKDSYLSILPEIIEGTLISEILLGGGMSRMSEPNKSSLNNSLLLLDDSVIFAFSDSGSGEGGFNSVN